MVSGDSPGQIPLRLLFLLPAGQPRLRKPECGVPPRSSSFSSSVRRGDPDLGRKFAFAAEREPRNLNTTKVKVAGRGKVHFPQNTPEKGVNDNIPGSAQWQK